MVVFEHSGEPAQPKAGRGKPAPARVVDLVQRRLRSDPAYLALKNISCEYHDGMLTLCGSLPSYYLKQMAQVVVGEVEGVRQVDNRIEVVRPRGGGQ